MSNYFVAFVDSFATHADESACSLYPARRAALSTLALVIAAHAALFLTWLSHSTPQYSVGPVQPLYASIISPTPSKSQADTTLRHIKQLPRSKTLPLSAHADEPSQVSEPQPEAPAEPASASSASVDQPAVIPPRFDAAYLNNPPPRYPAASRHLGEQGRVLVRVYVDASGLPAHVELNKSSGYVRLDNAALEAVRRWRFAPARQGEQSIGAWVLVPVVFNLHS